MKVGDKVNYYNTTYEKSMVGVITALDVEVGHVWNWEENGVIYTSSRPYRNEKAFRPLGVEINGSLTRTYESVSLAN